MCSHRKESCFQKNLEKQASKQTKKTLDLQVCTTTAVILWVDTLRTVSGLHYQQVFHSMTFIIIYLFIYFCLPVTSFSLLPLKSFKKAMWWLVSLTFHFWSSNINFLISVWSFCKLEILNQRHFLATMQDMTIDCISIFLVLNRKDHQSVFIVHSLKKANILEKYINCLSTVAVILT